MELVILCAPSLLAMLLLALGVRLARTDGARAPSAGRLVAAYALALPSFAMAPCWGWLLDGMWMFQPNVLPWLAGVALTGFTAWYLWKAWQRVQKKRDEARDEGPAPLAHLGGATLGIVVLFGLAVALLSVFAMGSGGAL